MTVSPPLPAAVVFDCDGTLADTESLSDRAWSEMLADRGYTTTSEDLRAVVGHPYAANVRYFQARVDLGDPEEFRTRLRRRFLALFETELVLHDDAIEVVRALAAGGVPIGVASSSTHDHVRRVLEHGDLTSAVQVIVGADDVEEHKPRPAPYLAAAAALGVEPGGCTAVEDTGVGVAAARAAGMFTVAVLRDHQTPDDLAAADRVVDRLTLAALSG